MCVYTTLYKYMHSRWLDIININLQILLLYINIYEFGCVYYIWLPHTFVKSVLNRNLGYYIMLTARYLT